VQLIYDHNKKPILCNLQPLTDAQIQKIHPDMVKFLTIEGVTPHSWHAQYSDACKKVAEKTKTDFIDIRAAMEKDGNEVIADYCLDPNASGHSIIANTIMQEFRNKGLI
jgi:hypothetical protein